MITVMNPGTGFWRILELNFAFNYLRDGQVWFEFPMLTLFFQAVVLTVHSMWKKI
jgi:hypothetical protein